MWNLPRWGIEPMSPEFAGRFPSIVPPRKFEDDRCAKSWRVDFLNSYHESLCLRYILIKKSCKKSGPQLYSDSVQFSSVAQSCLRSHGLQHARLPCPSPTARACSNSCPSSQWCHQPSYPLLPPSPPTFNLFQYQGLFQWVSSSHQVAKVLELPLQHQSFQWIFRTDFL